AIQSSISAFLQPSFAGDFRCNFNPSEKPRNSKLLQDRSAARTGQQVIASAPSLIATPLGAIVRADTDRAICLDRCQPGSPNVGRVGATYRRGLRPQTALPALRPAIARPARACYQ